ncbi:MAG: TIR domain-containing protein [Acidimicrobiia bacterium]
MTSPTEDAKISLASEPLVKGNGDRPQPMLFLSYGTPNAVEARELRRMLSESGYRVWMAPDDIRGPDSWPDQVLNAINKSSMMVVLVSSDALASRHVGREVNLAIEQGKPLLPVRVADVKVSGTLAYLLALVQWVDVFPPPLAHHQQLLVDRIKDLLSDIDVSATTIASPPPPAPEPVLPPVVLQTEEKKRPRWLWPVAAGALGLVALLAFLLWPRTEAGLTPGQPTAFQIEALTATQARLEWRAPSVSADDLDGYTIFRDGAELTTVSPGVTEYIDGSLEAGITYEYQLDAFNQAGAHSTRTAARLVSTPDTTTASTTQPTPSTTSQSSSTTAGTTTELDPELLAFFDWADPSICEAVAPADFVGEGIEHEIICDSEGVTVYYTVWNSIKSLDGRTEFHAESDPSFPWFTFEGIQRGLASEYILDDGRAVKFWTYDDNPSFPVSGEALRTDGDLDALNDWWANDGSQVSTTLTRTAEEDQLLGYLAFSNTTDCWALRGSAIQPATAELRCELLADGLEIWAYIDLWPSLTELDGYYDSLVTDYTGVTDTWSYNSAGDVTIGRSVEYSYNEEHWYFWTYDEDLISVNAVLLSEGTAADLLAWWESGAAARADTSGAG